MNLFNRKTLKRHIKPAPIPFDHLTILEAWADMIRSGRVYALKETALHGQFAAKIIEGVTSRRLVLDDVSVDLAQMRAAAACPTPCHCEFPAAYMRKAIRR